MTTINGCGDEIEVRVKKGFAFKTVIKECGVDNFLCDACVEKMRWDSQHLDEVLKGETFPDGF